jgi:RNA polymerase sigma-70 factor (ECF subfamily)
VFNVNPEYKKFSDEELIREFQKDRIEAYNEIVIRYKDRLINFLFRFTGSKEEAEDLAQDTFLKLYRSKHLYKEIAKFSTWLYTIAVNIAKTELRKKSRYNTISISDFDPENDKDFDIQSGDISPEDIANASIENYYIQKAIGMLEEHYREALILRDIQELEYDEIAKIINVPLGTVKSRINRAREKLKTILEEIYKQ